MVTGKTFPEEPQVCFFTYAPENCPIEIKSIDDLLDPALKGQIPVAKPDSQH